MSSSVPFDPLEFLEQAVAIPSHDGVDDMRTYLIETLEQSDHDVDVDDAGNVLSSRGHSGPTVVLNTHIDTVAPHVPPRQEGNRLYGRGACDAKGSLAAFIAAFLAVEPTVGRVMLAVTPDEEATSNGAAALCDLLEAAAVIVGEPTDLDICHAARGRFEGIIDIRGRRAHAAEPDSGVNAIHGAGRVLTALETFDNRPGATPIHSELGAPTLTPTLIVGGDASNQVPARCQVTIDRRSVPPETATSFATALDDYLAETVPTVDATYCHADRETPFLDAFRTDPTSGPVTALRDAGAGRVRPFTAATEAAYFAQLAPTVVFGPGALRDDNGPVAHADREYIDLTAVTDAATILTRALSTMV